MPTPQPPQWHWIGFGEITKQIEVRPAAMDEEGNYGNKYHLDQVEPDEIANFSGKFLTLEQLMELRQIAKTPGGTYSVTTILGQTWEGLLVTLRPQYIEGSYFHRAQIGLLNPTVTGGEGG
jgi:hypothetical protein